MNEGEVFGGALLGSGKEGGALGTFLVMDGGLPGCSMMLGWMGGWVGGFGRWWRRCGLQPE